MRGTTKQTVRLAKRLRRQMSLPEVLVWRLLQAETLKFRRQHPLGPYVLDFYCPEAKLAIEIDGMAHDMGDRPAHDLVRDAYVSARGIETIRVPARAVLASPEDVAASIIAAAEVRIGI